MKIALGRKADYAIRAVLGLAVGGTRMKTRELASEMAIPENYLPQILATLVRAGMVRSIAGPAGGYELLKDPGEISLLDVVEAADGPVKSTECVLRGGPCEWENACAVHPAWYAAQDALIRELAATSFEDIAREDRRLRKSAAEAG